MGRFFIETSNGQIATHGQLLAAGLIADGDDAPVLPWHPVQGSPDATTLWHAVMRKKERGVFIGTLVLRHGDHHASLLAGGWEDVPMDELRAPLEKRLVRFSDGQELRRSDVRDHPM